MPSYRHLECASPSCRLRFPGVPGVACPMCGGNTVSTCRPSAGAFDRPEKGSLPYPLEVVVDNVRSVYNVGSIFRSADGAGAVRLHLCGISPTPDHPTMAKTALGAETQIPWTRHRNAIDCAEALASRGVPLWALERTENSGDVFSAAALRAPGPLAVIIGNEVSGVDPELLDRCERVVHIPMRGHKDSLNVASAFAIAAYALTHRR